uniref:Protein Nef n=1 Tax=Human immunodeficiency virus type 1 TaxID=11676 RepID=Q5U6S3_HV1|nr:nef protein [Human immunodeficiency virus 1]
MGGKWSKSSIVGWPQIRERIRQAPPAAPPAAKGVGAVSQDVGKYEAVTDSQEEEEVAFQSGHKSFKTNDLQGSSGSQPLFKRKGGTGWVNLLRKRQEILDLWVYNTQGYFPDWHNYTPGPGIRYPLTFGWCFKLVPVNPEEVEKANEGENNCLLHPICQHGMDDEERETLMWKFDSHLAFKHMAHELHPEFYKDC